MSAPDRSPSIGSRIMSLLRGLLSLVETLISAFLSLIFAIFFFWLNQKQDELDHLEDRPEQD